MGKVIVLPDMRGGTFNQAGKGIKAVTFQNLCHIAAKDIAKHGIGMAGNDLFP